MRFTRRRGAYNELAKAVSDQIMQELYPRRPDPIRALWKGIDGKPAIFWTKEDWDYASRL